MKSKLQYSLLLCTLIGNIVEADNYVATMNHPPYSINKKIILGTYVGNRLEYTLDGNDPEGDEIFFVIDNQTTLSLAGIECSIYNTRQLVCSLSREIEVNSESDCTTDDQIIEHCESTEIEYHVVDEYGLESSDRYLVKLLITMPDSNGSIDVSKNQRGFYSEITESTRESEYGLAAVSENPAVTIMNTDMFDEDSILGKQLEYAKQEISSGESESFSSEVVINNTNAIDALGDSANTLDQQFLNDIITDTVNSMGQTVFNAPIYCNIEREGIKSTNYFYCTLYNEDTKYLANNPQASVMAYQDCKRSCVENAVCDTIEEDMYSDLTRNQNYLSETSHILSQNSVRELDTTNSVTVYRKNPDGTFLGSNTSYFSSDIDTSSIVWDDTIIPSTVVLDDDLKLITTFMPDNKFTTSVNNNTYIIEPKVSYMANIGGQDVLNSYDGDMLFSIVFSKNNTKYTCPLPMVAGDTYEDEESCNNICNLQHECEFKTTSVEESGSFNTVRNYCKDTQISYGGVQLSLESAVEQGKCTLLSEVAIQRDGTEGKVFVENKIARSGYRPAIGFGEGEDAIKDEKAAEVTAAFSDMLLNGKSDNRFDETDALDDELFRNFENSRDNKLFDALAVMQGTNYTNLDLSILIKLNDSYFNKRRLDIADYNSLDGFFERFIYNTYKNMTQSYPEKDEFQTWINTLNDSSQRETVEEIENIFSNTIESENSVGIIVGLVSVNLPIEQTENVANNISFRIMDNYGAFRTVAVGSPFTPIDLEDDRQVAIYKSYLKYTGDEPGIVEVADWINNIDSNDTVVIENRLKEYFRTTMTTQDKPFIDYYENNETTSVLNSMLRNYSAAATGVFDVATMSFNTASHPVSNRVKVLINDDMYNDTVLNYASLKTYYNNESLISKPIELNHYKKSPNSIYEYDHQYLFAYVDKIDNLRDLKVKDIMDIIYEDYRSGNKDYLVWDFKDRTKVIQKISSNVVDLKDFQEINHLGRYITVDSFSYMGQEDAISTYYEDISKNKEDSIYIAKRGDSYILKMNTSGENIGYSGKACDDEHIYDITKHKCMKTISETVYDGEACDTGFVWNNTEQSCIGENLYSWVCNVIATRIGLHGYTYTEQISNCTGDVSTHGACGDFDEGCSYNSPAGRIEMGEEESYTTTYGNEGFVYQYIGRTFKNISTKDFVSTERVGPSCNEGFTPDENGHCYTDESNIEELEPLCDTADIGGNCYSIDSNLIETANRNGYYFLYLQNKDNSNEVKFLTPIVNSSPIQCNKKSIKCDVSNEIFYSEESCQNYCKSFEDNTVSYGNCIDLEIEPSLLKAENYYELNSCNSGCYKTEVKSLNVIKTRLRIGDDIATSMGDISITKYVDGVSTDFTNQIINASGNIYLSEDNSGINLGAFSKDSTITIKYLPRNIDGNYTIGIGRDTITHIESSNNISPLFIESQDLGNCVNMISYYPLMGIYLDIDKNADGIYDTTIKLSETFLCSPQQLSVIEQNIEFKGTTIEYDFISYLGEKEHLIKELSIKSFGECTIENGSTNEIPLSQKYLSSDYIPNTSKITVTSNGKDINASMRFARKTFSAGLGFITKDLSVYAGDNRIVDANQLFEEINENKNIPIPFYEGVFFDDDFDVILENTNLDKDFDSSVSNYKLKAGYGFSPWNDCRTWMGDTTKTEFEYVDKTDCSAYTGYSYDTTTKKCIGVQNRTLSGDRSCSYGTVNELRLCEALPTCAVGYDEDISNNERCFRTRKITEQGIIKVCKPWWTLRRAYQCSGIDNVYDSTNILSTGVVRNVDVCTQKTKIFKSLAIDENGNIVEVISNEE